MVLYWSKIMKKIYLAWLPAFAGMTIITACSPTLDMQGHDPREYYAAHPIENKLDSKNFVQLVKFEEKSDIISAEKLDLLKANLQQINPQAASSIQLRISTVMQHKKQRITYVKKTLREIGYNVTMQFITTEDLKPNEVLIDISYIAVISPDCPDWRKSPVTTYSNTSAANFGCASTVNLGLMVNNPHDLVYGTGTNINNTQRSGKALSDYNSGAAAPEAATATGQ